VAEQRSVARTPHFGPAVAERGIGAIRATMHEQRRDEQFGAHIEETAAIFKALSIPRLQTLTTLAGGERNVSEIVWAEHNR